MRNAFAVPPPSADKKAVAEDAPGRAALGGGIFALGVTTTMVMARTVASRLTIDAAIEPLTHLLAGDEA